MADNYIENQYEAYLARKAAWEQEKKYKRKQPSAPKPPAQQPCRQLFKGHGKKVVAVHDLSGIGRVSLMAVIPILSSMGLQVCPLPTAILSNHTQYPIYTFLDLTEEMKRIIGKWRQLDMRFDAFYTGYLGSPQQAQIVEDFIQRFRRPDDLVVVDPVMGDNGNLYKGITEEMVTEMKKLICLADIITPNMTELFRLLDQPFQKSITDAALKQALKALSDRGPSIVIVTSVPVQGDPPLHLGLRLQPLWQPLLEGDLPLPARPLSRHGRHLHERHHRLADARRQPAHRPRPRHAVHPARHPCYLWLRIQPPGGHHAREGAAQPGHAHTGEQLRAGGVGTCRHPPRHPTARDGEAKVPPPGSTGTSARRQTYPRRAAQACPRAGRRVTSTSYRKGCAG